MGRTLPSVSATKRQAVADGVHARLERMLALAEMTRPCHALVTYLRYEIESAQAVDALSLSRAHASAYAAAASRARNFARALASDSARTAVPA